MAQNCSEVAMYYGKNLNLPKQIQYYKKDCELNNSYSYLQVGYFYTAIVTNKDQEKAVQNMVMYYNKNC